MILCPTKWIRWSPIYLDLSEPIFHSEGSTTAEFEATEIKSLLEASGIAAVIVGDSVLPNFRSKCASPPKTWIARCSSLKTTSKVGPKRLRLPNARVSNPSPIDKSPDPSDPYLVLDQISTGISFAATAFPIF